MSSLDIGPVHRRLSAGDGILSGISGAYCLTVLPGRKTALIRLTIDLL
jgi:hypothetical protein